MFRQWEGDAMSIIKLHERLERIEAAYLAALAGRFPETVPSSIWRAAILDAVPDVTIEELIAMFNWRRRKADRRWREYLEERKR
jgi:hypothetical protein